MPVGVNSGVLYVEELDEQKIFMLGGPLSLEGPLPDQTDYWYNYSGGERSENVLEYIPARRKKPGILFKPLRYIRPVDLQKLVSLMPGSVARLDITWGDCQRVSRHFGGLRARVKLMILREAKRGGGWEEEVARNCGGDVPRSIKLNSPGSLSLQTIRRDRLEPVPTDPCGEVVSGAFDYGYSGEFIIKGGV